VIYDSGLDRARQPSSDGRTVIDAFGTSLAGKIGEYRRYRTLFFFLTARDVMLRYRQTVLGVLWAVLQPILPMVIFTVIFSRVLRPETGGVPYSVFALAGLAPWTFFANAITASGTTFINSHNLLNKVYFPRAILPAAAVAACLIDWVVVAVFLLGLVLWSGYRPTTEWLFLPLLAAITTTLAMAVGLALASLMAMYRDVKHVLPFLVQIWMYATPVLYPAKLVPSKFQWAVALNPMAAVVEAFRSCLFGTTVDWNLMGVAGLSGILIAAAAVLLFHRLEADLAERV
jgi:lipopolysaccharide transport system permease protein